MHAARTTPSLRAVLLLALACFLLGTGIHIACGLFPKSIDVMPDELRYLGLARSLFDGNGLVLHGETVSFQKILYPLSLFPALLFADGQEQVRAIGILNSLYACSTVFPVALIARKLFRSPLPIAASLVLAMLLPDLMYSMTFMSESLFLPLALWLCYACWRCFEATGAREYGLACASGALCYLVYLCKEVAWMFLIAFLAFYLLACVRKRIAWQHAIMSGGLFLIGFLAPFVIMKLTLFAGMMNSYSQFSFDILLSPYTVLFGLYALATDATYFVVGFGVFPVLFILSIYRYLPRSERNLAFFCLSSLLIGLACVVFTISMREDVGHVALRQHLRYVIPLYLPLLMLFIQQVSRFDPAKLLRNPQRLSFAVALTLAFCVLVAAFFGEANLRQGFDNSQFHFMRWLLEQSQPLAQEYHSTWANTMSAIATDDGDLLVIDPFNWLCRAAVVLFTLVGMRLLLSRDKELRMNAGIAICSILASLMLANTVCAYHYNLKAYGAQEEDIAEICEINGQLAALADPSQVVIVLDDGNTKNNNLVDTYLQDATGSYRYLKPDGLLSLLGNEVESALPEQMPPRYLLVNVKQGVQVVSGNATVVGGAGESDDGRFILYHVTDDEPLKVLIASS